jgi:membrane protease YdiL (CAAX protease family)
MLTHLFFHRTLRGLGWGWGRTRYQALSYVLPVAYAAPVYLLVWLTGLGGFQESPVTNVLLLISVGTLFSVFSGLGEEIGWRGFLVPRLATVMSLPKVSFFSGFIWFAWHVPLILGAGYEAGAPAWYSMICFGVMAIGISFAFTWLRLASGSLWTAAILHGTHNLFIQGFFDASTADTGPTEYITGEFGIGLAITAIVVAVVFHRKGDPRPVEASATG